MNKVEFQHKEETLNQEYISIKSSDVKKGRSPLCLQPVKPAGVSGET
jgi:hypothetical protein